MALKADFIADVAARCADMLSAAGYTFQAADNHDTIITYASVKHRRISTRPRTVHKARYIVPPHLAAGEQQLLAKVAVGGDLWPHQSRKIGNVAIEDGMLNDYGIQHFHLGTTPDTRHPQLIQGTPELLFAVVKDSDFYALGIFDHKAWSKQALLDVIQANWPQLIAPYAVRDSEHITVLGLRHNYTEAEAAQLRKNNINVLQQRPNGTIHFGPGGGMGTNGKSLSATTDAIRLEKHVKELQAQAIATLKAKVATTGLPADTLIRVEWRGDVPFAVSVPAGCELDLSKRLAIPPL
jgi:hypothetical protein